MSLVRRIYYRYTRICTNNKQVCGICGNDLFCRNIVLPTFFVYYYKILSVLITIKYIKVIDNNFSQLLINVICQNYFPKMYLLIPFLWPPTSVEVISVGQHYQLAANSPPETSKPNKLSQLLPHITHLTPNSFQLSNVNQSKRQITWTGSHPKQPMFPWTLISPRKWNFSVPNYAVIFIRPT